MLIENNYLAKEIELVTFRPTCLFVHLDYNNNNNNNNNNNLFAYIAHFL